MKEKTPGSSLITTRKIVSPEHLNPNGSLFGGYLMCWMDEVAFMCARVYSGQTRCVTVNIDNIHFRTPLKLGEHVLLTARVNYAGRSSMEIEVKVEKEDPETGEKIHTNNAHLTFVCLDEKSRPMAVPKLKLENREDERLYWETQVRIKVRKRLKSFLERKLKGEVKITPQKVETIKFKFIEKWLGEGIDFLEKIKSLRTQF